MRISRIHIERFLGLRDIDIEISNEMQLIAGPNNAGKSSILVAIDTFFSAQKEDDLLWALPENRYYQEEGNRSLSRIKLYFSDLSGDELKAFKPALMRGNIFWAELKINRLGVPDFVASKGANGPEIFEKLTEIYDVIYVPAVRAGSSDITKHEIGKIFSTTKSIIARTRRGKLSTLQRNFQTKANDVFEIFSEILEGGREAISESLPNGTNISFEFPHATDLADLIFSNTKIKTRSGTSITLEKEGTGLQSLLSLGILDFFTKASKGTNQLFLIEEPEAFLHPQYQRVVADFLLKISKKAQLLLTTHSGVIVDSTHIENIVRLHRDPGGLVMIWKSMESDEKEIGLLNRFCNIKNSEIIFADKVIFCEGITDLLVIKELVAQIDKDGIHHKNISILDGDGESIVNVARIANLFNVPRLIILDKDAYIGDREKLRKLCTLFEAPLTEADYKSIDRARAAPPDNFRDAAAQRESINKLMAKRSIHIMGGDIEAAIAFSYKPKHILPALGKTEGAGHLSAESESSLQSLSAHNYYQGMCAAIGSKGWANERANKDRKPKPHVFPSALRRLKGKEIENSDISSLKKSISEFIEPDEL